MNIHAAVKRAALVACAVIFVAVLAEARFPQPAAEYQARRGALRSKLDGPLVLFGYTSKQDPSEVAIFFQEPSFYYLSGHDEADAALMILPDAPAGQTWNGPHEILYLPARNLQLEKWEGAKLGPDDPGIAAKTGFEAVKNADKFAADLQAAEKIWPNVYTALPPKDGKGNVDEPGYPHFTKANEWIKATVPNATIKDGAPAIYAMRQVKSAGELALLQKAIDLSVDAHIDAMKTIKPGLFEYQVAARMKQIHEWGGCAREAYAPIVGTGLNSTVLHYDVLDAQIQDGDVVVIDVGGEYGGYAADVTRTLPANGKFTPRQKEIYDIVLGAQNATLAAVKPGARIHGGADNLNAISMNYINTHGKDREGQPLGKYYIHGVSHHLGLDVHDPGKTDRPLEPGMVITIEPGIYIPEEKLGVRIEDDVLVTETGYKILSERAPRTAEEVEAMMASGHGGGTQ
jgi:Xaa-Pro aminopeptidase